MRIERRGFTLIELMIVIAVIGILAAIGTANYSSMVRKSADAFTKGNLGSIRSALSIYYSDNEGHFPYDNLASITSNTRYLTLVPIARVLPYHGDLNMVSVEATPTETGGWSYNNSNATPAWGAIHVGCLHQDSRNQVWSTY